MIRRLESSSFRAATGWQASWTLVDGENAQALSFLLCAVALTSNFKVKQIARPKKIPPLNPATRNVHYGILIVAITGDVCTYSSDFGSGLSRYWHAWDR